MRISMLNIICRFQGGDADESEAKPSWAQDDEAASTERNAISTLPTPAAPSEGARKVS